MKIIFNSLLLFNIIVEIIKVENISLSSKTDANSNTNLKHKSKESNNANKMNNYNKNHFFMINKINYEVAHDIENYFAQKNHYGSTKSKDNLESIHKKLQKSGFDTYERLIDILKNHPEEVLEPIETFTNFNKTENNNYSRFLDVGDREFDSNKINLNLTEFERNEKHSFYLDIFDENSKNNKKLEENENKFLKKIENGAIDQDILLEEYDVDFINNLENSLIK